MKLKLKCYECKANCDPAKEQVEVCEVGSMCWKWSQTQADGTKLVKLRGCVSNLQVADYCGQGSFAAEQVQIDCCHYSYCNGGPSFVPAPRLPKTANTNRGNHHVSSTSSALFVAIFVPLLFLVFVTGLIVTLIHYRKRRSLVPRRSVELSSRSQPDPELVDADRAPIRAPSIGYKYRCKREPKQQEVRNDPDDELVDELTLVECLSKDGDFGCKVWLVERDRKKLAARVYSEERAWRREAELHRLLGGSHDNIVHYVGRKRLSPGDGFLLVTEYYPKGSLSSYLSQLTGPLCHHEMFKACLGITGGLSYLHGLENTTAHGDLGSKSVLVRKNGECVLGNLTHVVTHDRLAAGKVDRQRASKRYMAPELLQGRLEPPFLKDFLRADIYSLGLVFWEVCRLCSSSSSSSCVALDYSLPFSEWIPTSGEPSLQEMRRLVVAEHRRPAVPSDWNADPFLAGMGVIIKECWKTRAGARPDVLEIKETIIKLAANNPDLTYL